MIHFSRSMPTGNLDDSTPPAPSEPVPQRQFRLPAEYYCAPLSEVRPVFPKWAPYGCGAAAALFLVLLFIGGTLLNGPRFGTVLDFVIGTSLGELRGMYAADITKPQKDRFEAEVKRMRDDLRGGRVPLQKVRPFLQTMQKAISDKKVTPDELEHLTKTASDASPQKR